MTVAKGFSLLVRLATLVVLVTLVPFLTLLISESVLVTGGVMLLALIVALWSLQATVAPIRLLAQRLATASGHQNRGYSAQPREIDVITDTVHLLEKRVQDAQRAQNVYLGLYHNLFDASPLAIVLVDAQGQSLDANPAFEVLTGYQTDELQNGAWDRVVDPEDRQLARMLWRDALQEPGKLTQSIRIIHKSHERHWAEVRVRRVENEFNGRNYMVILRDISTQKQALDLLHLERRKAIAVMDAAQDAVMLTDENNFIQYLNSAAQALIGSGVSAVGRSLFAVLKLLASDVRVSMEPGNGGSVQKMQVVALEAEAGRQQNIEVTTHLVHDDESQTGFKVLVLRALSEAETESADRQWAQCHDLLTGLANRTAFESFLQACLIKNATQATPAVVALVDLDHFRQLNTDEGRETGDEVLRQVAQVLIRHVRQCDLVARFGGDEFGVLLTGCDSNRALLIIEGIRADLAKLHLEAGQECRITASIGFTELTPEDKEVQSVLRRADEGCCRAKVQGRNLVNRVLPEQTARLHLQDMAVKPDSVVAEEAAVATAARGETALNTAPDNGRRD